MINALYQQLEDVVQDALFPDVDLALRRGRHIDLADIEWYAFLDEAQPFLETFYRRYGCELIRAAAGFFYLLPTGERLGRRQLTTGEMLVGQCLALIYLDPGTVRASGVVPLSQAIELLANLVGKDRLVGALNPRKTGRYDERVSQKVVRTEVSKAIKGLQKLGFVDEVEADRIRLRLPLTRFSDPVRGLADPRQALARLAASGEVALGGAEPETDNGGDRE